MRRATPADAAGIAGVHVRAWQIGYRGLVPDEILDGLSLARRKSTWHTLLARDGEGAFSLVAEDDRVVGFCSVIAPSRDDDAGVGTCEVAAIYVDPGHWRKGIGSALLVTALHQLGAARWDDVTLWVLAQNEGAIAFYRRFAFAADGAATWHELSGQREVRLRAPIRPARGDPTQRGSRRAYR